MKIDDEFYRRLGRLLFACTMLDGRALDLLEALLETSHRARAVLLEGMTNARVLEAIRLAAAVSLVADPAHEELKAAVLDWVRRADKVRVDRNAMVHAEWGVESESGLAGIVGRPRVTRSGWDFGRIWSTVTAEELEDLTTRALELRVEWGPLWTAIRATQEPGSATDI